MCASQLYCSVDTYTYEETCISNLLSILIMSYFDHRNDPFSLFSDASCTSQLYLYVYALSNELHTCHVLSMLAMSFYTIFPYASSWGPLKSMYTIQECFVCMSLSHTLKLMGLLMIAKYLLSIQQGSQRSLYPPPSPLPPSPFIYLGVALNVTLLFLLSHYHPNKFIKSMQWCFLYTSCRHISGFVHCSVNVKYTDYKLMVSFQPVTSYLF